MDLFLLRHGLAVERDEFGGPDAERPLTPEGIKKMRRIARGLLALGCSFDLILSSPLRRARETADIVAAVHQVRRHLEITRRLAPEGKRAALIRQLAPLCDRPRAVLLVGHEPNFSELIATLVGAGRAEGFRMKKGGVCCLSLGKIRPGPCATLEWLLTPGQLARLGEG